MHLAPRARRSLLMALLLTACGGGGGGSATQTLPSGQWSWVDLPGTACSDGTPTGIAVNPAPEGAEQSIVLVFLDGGGACWGSSGPFACNGWTATPGPYQLSQFLADRDDLPGSILDRTVAGTPFGGATLVFVPYCTGDVHWGASEETDGGRTWRHAGRANLEAAAAWMAEHLEAPEKVVVSGSSAGGFGALLAHDVVRGAWPEARGYLVDDSGPPLVGDAIAADLRDAWYASWNLSATVGPLCGAACEDDLSRVLAALRARYPADRFALVSTLQDWTIRQFLDGVAAADYQGALLALVDQEFSSPGARAFLVPGDGHVLLGSMVTAEAGATRLNDWIRQMVDDEEGWTTQGRPQP